ncbi:zinc ABC transporter ATP-binding protein AztA [Agromyces salentinus]|uniref:zinc ABC transporter ATP-binding protein AztA n=1 Tax=Agromyces salentinus TaxID=269421 RepID=UPI001BA7EEF9|nr:zinc ABC transporter ATP-binding protein AztA [Agromyces salentinus]
MHATTPLARAIRLDVDLDGHPVLRDVSLSVRAGAVTVVVGPNGAGKSTLLETIAGLHRPRAGRVELAFPGEVALVPQRSAISTRLPVTVGELAAMGRWRRTGALRRLGRDDRAIVSASLEAVGIADLRRRPVAALSGGQRQRALLAQGLARRARLLLLDEPMNALDDESRSAVNAAIQTAVSGGTGVVVVTHALDELDRFDAVIRLP